MDDETFSRLSAEEQQQEIDRLLNQIERERRFEIAKRIVGCVFFTLLSGLAWLGLYWATEVASSSIVMGMTMLACGLTLGTLRILYLSLREYLLREDIG